MSNVRCFPFWPQGLLCLAIVLSQAVVQGAEQPISAALPTAFPTAIKSSSMALPPALPRAIGANAIASVGPQRARQLARRVTICRDAYGTPHINGDTDESVIFGFAYAQAEDYFWQVEDNYILSLGRYSEVHGPQGINSDLLNRAFEIVPQSKANFAHLDPQVRLLCAAYAAGLNYYLESHPEVKPRLISRFEPWHVLAYGRHLVLEMTFRYTRISNNYLPRSHDLIWAATGSNGWAIAPSRTRDGHAMLMVNPHLPWFGFAQFYEAHLRSGEGWNFTGATPYGSPILTLGHNEHLGWTLTTNEPDIADLWRVTFDDPTDPLKYQFDGGYRQATQWSETIKVKSAGGLVDRVYLMRKTHHGPVVAKEDGVHYLAARIAGLHHSQMLAQSMKMVRARTLDEFRQALAMQQFPLMNLVYADRAGNIFFMYNGLIPRRDPSLDWQKPVDGSDARTAWFGFHAPSELPAVLNPPCGYVQNCNSSPFTTCRDGNPSRGAFPPYMVQDADDDKRRAKRSRELLGEMQAVTLDEFQMAAFDTTVYWAQHELPRYQVRFEGLCKSHPKLAAEVRPYLEHLSKWDCRITAASTAATLCEAWYEELYGISYPAEKLLKKYASQPELEFQALVDAASKLRAQHGRWQVPWGELFRTQRPADVVDFLTLPFEDAKPSLPSLGGPGPMGVIFTQYSSPSLRIPFVRMPKKRYGLIGASYLAAYEFGDTVRGGSVMNFGSSGNPASPHYFDQAQLMAQGKMKPELFYWPDVLAEAKRVYHPGEQALVAKRK